MVWQPTKRATRPRGRKRADGAAGARAEGGARAGRAGVKSSSRGAAAAAAATAAVGTADPEACRERGTHRPKRGRRLELVAEAGAEGAAGGAVEGAAEAPINDERAWHEEWRERIGCWWLALPLLARTDLGQCLGAISLHLGARLDRQLGRAPPMATETEPACEVIRLHTPFSPYVAPRFPHMSEINSSLDVFFLSGSRERLQSSSSPSCRRLEASTSQCRRSRGCCPRGSSSRVCAATRRCSRLNLPLPR